MFFIRFLCFLVAQNSPQVNAQGDHRHLENSMFPIDYHGTEISLSGRSLQNIDEYMKMAATRIKYGVVDSTAVFGPKETNYGATKTIFERSHRIMHKRADKESLDEDETKEEEKKQKEKEKEEEKKQKEKEKEEEKKQKEKEKEEEKKQKEKEKEEEKKQKEKEKEEEKKQKEKEKEEEKKQKEKEKEEEKKQKEKEKEEKKKEKEEEK